MFAMKDVLRISDRYLSSTSSEALDRQGKLANLLVAVTIFHGIMSIGVIRMEQVERAHPRVIHETDIEFTLRVAPPDSSYRISPKETAEPPRPGLVPNPGAVEGGQTAEKNGENVKDPAKGTDTPDDSKLTIADTPSTPQAPPVLKVSPNQVKARPAIAEVPVASQAGMQGSNSDGEKQSTEGNPETAGTSENPGEIGKVGDGAGASDKNGDGADEEKIEEITHTVRDVRPMANISPYRHAMLSALAKNWRPSKKDARMVVLVSINKDGSLQQFSVLSYNHKRLLKEVEEALNLTEFPPLPEWYQGESLLFQLTLTSTVN